MQNIIQSRGINYILHFTQLGNLDSILANGINTRDYCETNQFQYSYNDSHRLDGHTNASCFSIGFPNYKMFYKLRRETDGVEWVVLALHPRLLIEKDCAFYPTNAASNPIRHVDPNTLKSAQALENMFSEVSGKPSRADLKLANFCTTDPQAEVLVFDQIEPSYIGGIATPSKTLADTLRARNLNIDVQYVDGFFSARKDYEHWK